MRELVVMAEGRAEEAWGRTSTLIAWIVNVHLDLKKTRPRMPSDFNPFCERAARNAPAMRVGIEVLKDVFVDRRMPTVN